MATNKIPMYAPMSDSRKYIKMQKDYLQSVDNKYGTQFTNQSIRKSGVKNER